MLNDNEQNKNDSRFKFFIINVLISGTHIMLFISVYL